jgi:TrmH family RNA methyltransferase
MDEEYEQRLQPILSHQNSRLKALRRALAKAEPTAAGECAIEGMHILEEALHAGLRLNTVFFSEATIERTAPRLLPQLARQTECLRLPHELFASAVTTETPQGVAALVRLKTHELSEILEAESPLLIATSGLQDPGNLGTILRSAEAFGATGALLSSHTVSPLNSKAIRASAGSFFRLPWVRTDDETLLTTLKNNGIRLAVTSSHQGTPADEADLRQPLCILIGGEGAGVPRELQRAAEVHLAIPQSPQVESLNAGIAASILLYEAQRQRRKSL